MAAGTGSPLRGFWEALWVAAGKPSGGLLELEALWVAAGTGATPSRKSGIFPAPAAPQARGAKVAYVTGAAPPSSKSGIFPARAASQARGAKVAYVTGAAPP